MNHKARLLPSLVLSAISFQCVTSKAGIPITKESTVLIECKYVDRSKSLVEADVECILQNKGSSPANIRFKKLALSDPDSAIVPVDAARIPSYEVFQSIVVILGVVVVLAAIVALASKSHSMGSVHIGVPDSPLPRPTLKMSSTTHEAVTVDTLEIPPYRSMVLAFKVRHRATRPANLVIQLDDLPGETLNVPIQENFKMTPKRSDFDY